MCKLCQVVLLLEGLAGLSHTLSSAKDWQAPCPPRRSNTLQYHHWMCCSGLQGKPGLWRHRRRERSFGSLLHHRTRRHWYERSTSDPWTRTSFTQTISIGGRRFTVGPLSRLLTFPQPRIPASSGPDGAVRQPIAPICSRARPPQVLMNPRSASPISPKL
jgi:hypothetical protein